MNPVIVELMEAGVAIVDKVVQLINDAKSGKIDPNEALSQIQSLHDKVAADDAAATAAEDAKFGKSI